MRRYKFVKILFLAALICILGVLAVVHFTHREATSASSYTKGESSPNSPSSTNPSKTNGQISTSSQAPSSNNGTAQTLLAPTGNFVSNHHPNLSGSPAPNTITSVCSSTPGATCVITFTKDGVTKSLGAKIIDAGGSAYWLNWNLQSIGLTTGSWNVKATASLNGQSKSASDAMPLEVSN